METYRDVKTTISIDVEFRVETTDIKSESELINLIQVKKEELDAEVKKAVTRLDCSILD